MTGSYSATTGTRVSSGSSSCGVWTVVTNPVPTIATSLSPVNSAPPAVAPTTKAPAASTGMTCGAGVTLCGLLTLESGYGTGNYNHTSPVVHGLWPETGSYGTSLCVPPSDSAADPEVVYSCYDQPGETAEQDLSFEQHEWEAHGVCAGTSPSFAPAYSCGGS